MFHQRGFGPFLTHVGIVGHDRQLVTHGVVNGERFVIGRVPDAIDGDHRSGNPIRAGTLALKQGGDLFVTQGIRKSHALFAGKNTEHITMTLIKVGYRAEVTFRKVKQSALFHGISLRSSITRDALLRCGSDFGLDRRSFKEQHQQKEKIVHGDK